MAEKSIQDLVNEIKELNKGNPEADLANSKELKDLEKSLHERHDDVEKNTELLKKDAETNKGFNKIQIAKEIFTLGAERKNLKAVMATESKTDAFQEKQKKHNQGAKNAREVILEQNQIILKKLQAFEKSGGMGGGGGTGEAAAIAEGNKVLKKVGADIDKADKARLGAGKGPAPVYGKGGMSKQDHANQVVRDEIALKRESNVTDVHDLGKGVKTTGESLNKRKISVDELDSGALQIKKMGQLRVGGVNVERQEEGYSTGTAKFKNTETGKFTQTDPVKALAEDIRISQGTVGTTRNREQFKASNASGMLSQKIGENAGDLQVAMDSNESAKTDLADLARILQDAQAGKEGVGRTQITTQVEKLKLSGGEDISKMLDLDKVGAESQGGKFGNIGASIKENVFGINQGTDAFSMKGVKEAFSADRIFGKADTGGKFSLSKLGAFQGKNEAQERALRVKEVDSQNEAQARMVGEEGLGFGTVKAINAVDDPANDVSGGGGKLEEWKEKWIPAEERYAQEIERQQENVDQQFNPSPGNQSSSATPTPTKGGGKGGSKKEDKRTGQDTESIPQKQLETLIEIRDLLQSTADAGAGDSDEGGSMLDNILPGRKNKKKGKKGKKNKGKSRVKAGNLMKGKAGLAMKGLGAVAAVGMGVYTAVSGVNKAEDMADAGELNAEEEQKAKSEAIGEGTGGASGALAGAAAGAAIGSIIPGVGTAIGGIIGGALGYFAGSKVGKAVGGKVADAIDVDPKTLQESNKQAEEVLKQIEEKDSTLAGAIKQEAKDIEAQMLEQAGDTVSDNDKAAIKNAAIVKALQAHNGEIENMGIDRKSIADNIEKAGEKAYDSAKDSGLYDKDLMGNSEIDKDKLGGASVAELQAIVADDDLSSEDMQAVKDTLAQKQMVAMSPVTPPTGGAVDNMTTQLADANASVASPVVVNNQGQNSPPPSIDDRPLIAVASPNVRNANSTLANRNLRTGVRV